MDLCPSAERLRLQRGGGGSMVGVPEKGAPLVAQTVKNSPTNAGDSG